MQIKHLENPLSVPILKNKREQLNPTMILKLKEFNQWDLLVKMENENHNFKSYQP
jgi:hypothetical protein